ncbi:co-activator of prophage gene expression IbrB [Klebsiella pneumoniae]|uniref:Co-activator of prophage gene expression IbrB n=1 Tax=Klebsiella pneumoniae TaxID=573 RepID=A0A377TRD5_KLEPN|nr:co-activator of prophage gene expression IbrB [Klebsiella pneumoniae]
MQQQLTQALEAYLQKLDDEARIEAINAFRQVLHHYSPFRSQPVDCVLWVKQELVAPNDYNPNNVAPPEKRLLQTSLEPTALPSRSSSSSNATGVYDCRWFSPP